MLGGYFTNGPVLYKDLNEQIFKFSFSFPGYQAVIRGLDPTETGGILKYSKVFNTYDDQLLSKIFRDLKAIVYAKFKGIGVNQGVKNISLYKTAEEIHKMLYDKEGVVHRLYDYKNNPQSEIKDNLFIQYLTAELPETAYEWITPLEGRPYKKEVGIAPGYIKGDKAGVKSGKEKDRLTNAWKELVTHPNPEIRAFGLELYEASFIMSGFSPTLFSFNELFDTDTRRAAGVNDFMKKENADLGNQTDYFTIDDLDIFYRNSWNNPSIVPQITPADIKTKEPGRIKVNDKVYPLNTIHYKKTGTFAYIKTKSKKVQLTTEFAGERQPDPGAYVPFITLRNDKTGQLDLYKLVGLSKSTLKEKQHAIYMPVSKLGYSERGKIIKELSTRDTAIDTNKLPDRLAKQIVKFKDQILRSAGLYSEFKTPFSTSETYFDKSDSYKGTTKEEEELALELEKEVNTSTVEVKNERVKESSPEPKERSVKLISIEEDVVMGDSTLQMRMTEKISEVMNPSARRHLPKEKVKTKVATQFIGEGVPGSSTDKYKNMYAEEGLANTGEYQENDIVFVSTNGKRRGRIHPIKDGKLQGEYKNIDKAIEAGAFIIADTRQHLIDTRSYNLGEIALTRYLNAKGYERISPESGIWAPKTRDVGVRAHELMDELSDFKHDMDHPVAQNIKDEMNALNPSVDEDIPVFKAKREDNYQLAESMKGYPKANLELDNILIDFLKRMGIDVKEESLEALRERYGTDTIGVCLLYTSPSPRDATL